MAALLAALFGALGIVLGGSFRAEITLAVANLVWFVHLFADGIIVFGEYASRRFGDRIRRAGDTTQLISDA